MKCGRCGAESPDGVRFCAVCGNDLNSPTDRQCPGCGRRVQMSYVACPHCGRSLTLQSSYGPTPGSGLASVKHLKYLSGAAILAGLCFVYWGVWNVWLMGYYEYVDGWNGWIITDTLLSFAAGFTCVIAGLLVLTSSSSR